MTATPLQSFWYYLTLLGKKEEVFAVLAPYGVTSIKFLSVQLQEELVDKLRAEWAERSKRPRGAVIHYLCVMPGKYNFKTTSGEPDYEKIDNWVKSKMEGKALNQLSLSQLNKAVQIVKAWYRREVQSTTKTTKP